MDTNIFCTLLAERINPEKFQLWGLEIKWLIEPTKEELIIVDDIISNYENYSQEYLINSQKEVSKQEALNNLDRFDKISIRAMREWIAKQPDAPIWLDSDGNTCSLSIIEAKADIERNKLKEG